MKCKDCKHADWTRNPSGSIKKKVPGRCRAEVVVPTLLCVYQPTHVHKCAIWPEYEGQCDLHEPAETEQ